MCSVMRGTDVHHQFGRARCGVTILPLVFISVIEMVPYQNVFNNYLTSSFIPHGTLSLDDGPVIVISARQ